MSVNADDEEYGEARLIAAAADRAERAFCSRAHLRLRHRLCGSGSCPFTSSARRLGLIEDVGGMTGHRRSFDADRVSRADCASALD